MKKRLLITIGLVLLTFISFNVNVKAEETISLSCEATTIAPGQATTCSITANSDKKIGSIDYNIAPDTDLLEFVSTAGANGFSGDINGSNASISNSAGVDGGTVVATFEVKALEGAAVGSTGQVTVNVESLGTIESDGESKDNEVASQSIGITIGEGTGAEATGTNPKTMDANPMVIFIVIAMASLAVLYSKKKLSKISR